MNHEDDDKGLGKDRTPQEQGSKWEVLGERWGVGNERKSSLFSLSSLSAPCVVFRLNSNKER